MQQLCKGESRKGIIDPGGNIIISGVIIDTFFILFLAARFFLEWLFRYFRSDSTPLIPSSRYFSIHAMGNP